MTETKGGTVKEFTPDRLRKILRYGDAGRVAHWEFGCEIRSDGDWATFSVPVHEDVPAQDIVHALALVVAAVVHRNMVNDTTRVEEWNWDDLLKGDSE